MSIDDFDLVHLTISPGSIKVSWKGSPRPAGTERKRKAITEWSRKSRSSMIRRLCTLDYSPLFTSPGNAPAVITLTYPGDWRAVAPDGAMAKRHLAALRKRYAREFGNPLRGVWKMEFQARGAVHFHIFCAPPIGKRFPQWLSVAWAEVVNAADPVERAAHVAAGTRVDWAEGIRAADPRRVAVYFTKHGSANFGDKEYQNVPPQEWLAEGKTLGRFWGYWLDPVETDVPVDKDRAIFAARVLRRWSRATLGTRRELVWRTHTGSGVIYRRHARRRVRRMRGHAGFISANDGPRLADHIARAIDARFGVPNDAATGDTPSSEIPRSG
ncbi:MAG: hypothetical protein HY996_07260 [Micrococcales bacterium]|nr:hypothetical protein [Micrococcales bacterium]